MIPAPRGIRGQEKDTAFLSILGYREATPWRATVERRRNVHHKYRIQKTG